MEVSYTQLGFTLLIDALIVAGQQVVNILIDKYVDFKNVDILKMSGDLYTPLVLKHDCSGPWENFKDSFASKKGGG